MLTDEQIAAAAERWTSLAISAEAVRAYAARCAPEGPALESLPELVLAAGCSAGDPAALALFDAHYLDAVPAAVAHMKLSPTRIDEVRQQVRERLLVSPAPGEPPRIDAYVARGRLRGLVKIVAVRTAISLIRKDRPNDGEGAIDRLAAVADDPELKVMKARYRAAFAQAFEQAVMALTSRERNLLRLQLEGGMTVEQLGEVYGVHRATATRWLAKIREQLLKDTRRRLGEELGASRDELDSVMKLIQSRLDVSMRRMLQTVDADLTPEAAGAPSSDPSP